MDLSEAEKKELDELQKKLNHYWNYILVPFEQTLRDLDEIAKEVALEDFYQMQYDWKPTDAEISRLKSLAHKNPETAQIVSGDLLSIEEMETQIMNMLQT